MGVIASFYDGFLFLIVYLLFVYPQLNTIKTVPPIVTRFL